MIMEEHIVCAVIAVVVGIIGAVIAYSERGQALSGVPRRSKRVVQRGLDQLTESLRESYPGADDDRNPGALYQSLPGNRIESYWA